jgi:hypothetical protein
MRYQPALNERLPRSSFRDRGSMSYILFVNPAILSAAGLPFDAVAVAPRFVVVFHVKRAGLRRPFHYCGGISVRGDNLRTD